MTFVMFTGPCQNKNIYVYKEVRKYGTVKL